MGICKGLDELSIDTTALTAFARLAGVEEKLLDNVAVLNVCCVTVQAAFGPQRGHSRQSLLQTATDVKTKLLKHDADLPPSFAMIKRNWLKYCSRPCKIRASPGRPGQA